MNGLVPLTIHAHGGSERWRRFEYVTSHLRNGGVLCLRIARDLQVGIVWVNDWVVIRDEFEEGGYKQSGRGRLRGLAALDDFSSTSTSYLNPVS